MALVLVAAWLYCVARGCCCCCMPVDPPYAQTHATAAIQVKNDADCCCFGVGPRQKVLYIHHIDSGPRDVEGDMKNVLSVDDTTHLAIVAREQGHVRLSCTSFDGSPSPAGSNMRCATERLPRPSDQRFAFRHHIHCLCSCSCLQLHEYATNQHAKRSAGLQHRLTAGTRFLPPRNMPFDLATCTPWVPECTLSSTTPTVPIT